MLSCYVGFFAEIGVKLMHSSHSLVLDMGKMFNLILRDQKKGPEGNFNG